MNRLTIRFSRKSDSAGLITASIENKQVGYIKLLYTRLPTFFDYHTLHVNDTFVNEEYRQRSIATKLRTYLIKHFNDFTVTGFIDNEMHIFHQGSKDYKIKDWRKCSPPPETHLISEKKLSKLPNTNKNEMMM